MNQKVKLAKELVRIAKSLIAATNIFDEMIENGNQLAKKEEFIFNKLDEGDYDFFYEQIIETKLVIEDVDFMIQYSKSHDVDLSFLQLFYLIFSHSYYWSKLNEEQRKYVFNEICHSEGNVDEIFDTPELLNKLNENELNKVFIIASKNFSDSQIIYYLDKFNYDKTEKFLNYLVSYRKNLSELCKDKDFQKYLTPSILDKVNLSPESKGKILFNLFCEQKLIRGITSPEEKITLDMFLDYCGFNEMLKLFKYNILNVSEQYDALDKIAKDFSKDEIKKLIEQGKIFNHVATVVNIDMNDLVNELIKYKRKDVLFLFLTDDLFISYLTSNIKNKIHKSGLIKMYL